LGRLFSHSGIETGRPKAARYVAAELYECSICLVKLTISAVPGTLLRAPGINHPDLAHLNCTILPSGSQQSMVA